MKALDHMHRKGIFHRDIKPENILIEGSSDAGKGLKLADFGSCRGIYSKQPYTEYISTRWYRAPECLLTDGYYGPEMDLWGAGCVMFEITSLYPLFPGSNEVDQISRIHKVLGTPSAELLQKFKSKGASHVSFDFPPQKGVGIPQLIPHASSDAIDLIVKLLKYVSSLHFPGVYLFGLTCLGYVCVCVAASAYCMKSSLLVNLWIDCLCGCPVDTTPLTALVPVRRCATRTSRRLEKQTPRRQPTAMQLGPNSSQ